ncbi:MAG TPA: alpha/beta hydrolase [Polyangiaceae bacterium]|jgi:pimeloyl-ACP methyl ester carboxylesterase|nr:alpha/beta hydrolase [Polyangiaceae bacterium]
MKHERITTNGVSLHVVTDGPKDGPLVILLHGFPEYWYSWRHQIPFLADQGFCVWAPDQRGYNESDKPDGVSAYSVAELAKDVMGLIDASGRDKVYLVGHDWGAVVAWWTAIHYPERLHKMAVLNVPHPVVMERTMRTSLKQLRMSWYIFFFQLPFLPELGFKRRGGRDMAEAMQRTARKGTFSDEDLDRYREAWAKPGAVTAMINWYRAIFRARPPIPRDTRIRVPTLLIWGARDVALSRQMAQPSIDMCDDGRLVLIEEATHWVQHDEPERVNQLLGDFLPRP